MLPMNIVDLIKQETAAYRENIAVTNGTRRLTYAQLLAEVDRVTGELIQKGMKSCQRVALLAPDSADYIIFSLAVLSAGAVIVPLSDFLSARERENILDDLDVNWIIDREFRCVARPALDCLPDAYYQCGPAFIRFSSGTTGKSKGVLLSHEAIIERTDAADKALKISPRDKIVWVLAMSFHFVVTILLFLRRAAEIVLCSNNFPDTLLAALKNVRPTFIYGSPFHYYLLSNSSAFTPEDLKDVRMAVSTAMRLPPEIAESFFKKFGFELTQAYGIIEAGLPFVNDSRDRSKRSSVGRLMDDYQLKIMDADSEGSGRVFIKGKGMFAAYCSPWRTSREAAPDGWFDTGDVGRLDQDGYFYVVGRAKEVINFCGMKIFPQEVEDVLNAHPAVAESKVAAQFHPQYGELPVAEVVLKEGVSRDFKTADLRKYCYQCLSSYKVPKEFCVVAVIEKTASGKIKR
jgi:long-chain acyl-CoA synthetase